MCFDSVMAKHFKIRDHDVAHILLVVYHKDGFWRRAGTILG